MGQKDEIILININGTDRPGVTAALTEILAKNNAVILDIGQADIHNNLSLGILFQSSEGNSGDILKELLFKSYELDVNIRFNPITEEAYNQWVSMQGKNRYIITILGPTNRRCYTHCCRPGHEHRRHQAFDGTYPFG
jgi:phosphoserine phosphatase